MRHEFLVEEIATRSGLDFAAAERALATILEGVGERLFPLDASWLAGELPAPLSEWVKRRERPGEFTVEEWCNRIAERDHVRVSAAREVAVAVCQVLARRLETRLVLELRERLPDDFAALFEVDSQVEERREPSGVRPGAVQARPGTLATGRPGSSRPLSEAAADRTQSGSVARAENPHGDTKLSSARGLSSEREGRTLATGRPGSLHPIDESD